MVCLLDGRPRNNTFGIFLWLCYSGTYLHVTFTNGVGFFSTLVRIAFSFGEIVVALVVLFLLLLLLEVGR